MIRMGRFQHSIEYTVRTETPARLVTDTWWVVVGLGSSVGAVAYRRPSFVISGDHRIPIIDLTALTRVAALAALSAVPLARRFRS